MNTIRLWVPAARGPRSHSGSLRGWHALIIAAVLFFLLEHVAAAQSRSAPQPRTASQQQSTPAPAEMFASGERYYWGRGVPIDWGAAAYWYAEAVQKGLPEAMTRLAVMYWRGEAVAYDKAQALELLRSAAELGRAAALTELGALYLEGDIVERDLRRATRYFRLDAQPHDLSFGCPSRLTWA